MSQAKQGDNVKIHYDGSLDDGTRFDSSPPAIEQGLGCLSQRRHEFDHSTPQATSQVTVHLSLQRIHA